MKMRSYVTMKAATILLVALAVLGSCKKDDGNAISTEDAQNVNSESVADTQTSETADMANSIVTSLTATTYSGGRTEGTDLGDLSGKDGRLKGATITLTVTSTNKDNPAGYITINFGSTGVTTNGVLRKGMITVTYQGRKDYGQSTRVISYTGYSRNGIVFDDGMVFTETNTAAQGVQDSTQFHHQLTGGLLTFPDNTTINRTADYNIAIAYDEVTKKITTLTLSASAATHSAYGTNRKSKPYHMDIKSPIVYKAECAASQFYLAASGKKDITVNDLITYSIDYGDGTCDNSVTITVGGKTVTLIVGIDGN